MRLIDGGVWANNPTMVAIVEGGQHVGGPAGFMRVLSLGTSDPVVIRPKCLSGGGCLQWGLAAVDVILRGQNRGAHAQAQHLLGKDRVIRLDPRVPDKLLRR